jgi:thioredoxin-related protein
MLTLLLTALFGTIPALQDLSAVGGEALRDHKPIVLFVSRTDCTFCKRFERDVLAPLVKSARFADQVIYRELVMNESGTIRDFSGQWVQPDALAQQLGVHVSPTLLIMDGNGRMLAKPKVGYDGNEYFSYYFERAIVQAIERLRGSPVSGR